MSEKAITLPNREEMLGRLLAVNDNSHLQERFYPLLLQHAGEEKVFQGVALLLMLAIHDYVQGLPPVVATLLYMQIDDFVDALVSDPEVAAATKAEFAEAMKKR